MLPINNVLPEVLTALRAHPACVIQAPTGSGKTTCVPPALLAAGLAGTGQIVMLEPRRLAARAAARWMACQRGEPLGTTIGYRVRFDHHANAQTRILVVTEGILLRMLLDDPFLENVSVVIFDEFHERSLDNDLCLGMARLLQQTVRPDLKIVVMSATLQTHAIANYLGKCPVITGAGRLHPVVVHWQPRKPHDPLPPAIHAAVVRLLEDTPGDVLVFLPGVAEIRQTQRQLETLATERDLLVVHLYGDLAAEQQDLALLPQPKRRIVLATNVAETSVTVEGVTGVVDSGFARILSHDPRVGMDRLQLQPISKASADQRAGRAGRTQPGTCIRLWSEHGHRARPDHTEPEIRRVDLAGPVLQLLCLGEKHPDRFPWFDPPPTHAITQATELLERLGAVRDGMVSALGKQMVQLPVHPRLGRLLVEGARRGMGKKAALAAALLSERDPFGRQEGPPEAASPSDVLDRVEAMEEFERSGRTAYGMGALQRGHAKFVLRARDQLLRALQHEGMSRPADGMEGEEAFLHCLLAAFPDRVARRREPKGAKGVLVGGRGVRLAPTSAVREGELFLCVDVDAGATEALVRQASLVQRGWLDPALMQTRTEVAFDDASGRVAARRRTYYLDLLLDESPMPSPPAHAIADALVEAAQTRLDEVLPPLESAAGVLLTRVRCLADWMPQLRLPRFDQVELIEGVRLLASSCRSLNDLRHADWTSVILGRLNYQQRQALEREAPERLLVPSGSKIALQYEMGRPPVLAVRMQEVFGWHGTPTIAGGRVKVLMHLLAPNYRPQQVTDDLASFWTTTYPLIRKELRARYPKHSWPEDPWTAEAVRGVRRR